MEAKRLNEDDVIVTERLSERPGRTPDYEVENRALEALAEELAQRPGNLLQKLAETIVDLGLGESAGISIEEMGELRRFRWVALAGVWSHLRGSTIPFNASPCGLAVRRDELLLIESPERFFAEARVEPLICEGLLLPFRVDGRPVGTLWVNAHNPARKFDAEDARLLKSFSRFASAGFRTVQALEEAQAGKDELEQRVAAQVSELKASEAQYRTLFDSVEQGVCIIERIPPGASGPVDFRYIAANAAFEELTGLRGVVGKTQREVVPSVEPHIVDSYDSVALTGLPWRFETRVAELDRWFEGEAVREERTGRIVVLFSEVTRRKRIEAALRESEERQSFLLQLSDALRPLGAPLTIQREACRLLRVRLGAIRVAWGKMKPDGVTCTVMGEDLADGALSLDGREWSWNDFDPAGLEKLKNSQTIHRDNVASANDLSRDQKATFSALNFQAFINVPLVKSGRLVAFFLVHYEEARTITPLEIALAEETAERTWAAFERARAEAALRESEERQAFLLKLSDALRPLTDALDIQETATRLLGEHLGARAVNYGLVEAVDGVDFYVIDRAYVAPGRRSTLGRWPVTDFPGFTVAMRAGATMAVDHVASDPNLMPRDKAGLALTDTAAFLMAPLVKNGRPTAMLCIVEDKPRTWTSTETALVQEVAERTWAAVERSKSEAALRVSEERFQQFATASAAGLWIRDARTLEMEFTSPAVGEIYGVEPDALLGDVKKWAAMIVPEDRAAALEHLEAARQDKIAVHEFRIQRASDAAFCWIRNTDFPLHDDGHVRRVGGIVEDITDTRQLRDHQGVLLAELQHRVRNIMGIIRSMANRTAPGAKDIEDYRSLLEGRLLALARVQALLTRQANAGASLRDIVEEEVAAQAHHSGQFELVGPDIMLAPKAVEVLTLAFHELATNALKYGALSIPEGRLTVSWAPCEKRGRQWLGIDWVETGAPPCAPSMRRGFGSELIEARIPYELGGTGSITIASEGARCRMEFPLKQAESILETDAPLPTTIFGGTLDMTGAADLTGRTVLVVEDDYYMARDTAAALDGAGANVLGPCPSEEATLDLLDTKTPTQAVLDLNLGGGGPKFAIAEELKRRGIPFIFLTGYDPDVIPADLADVPRLQKPIPFRSIVEAVARLDFNS